MLYDPTPIPVAVQQTSKQQSKKDKQKKIKNQITKPVNAESESNLMQIPIKLCNGKILDHINVQYQQENRNKIIME